MALRKACISGSLMGRDKRRYALTGINTKASAILLEYIDILTGERYKSGGRMIDHITDEVYGVFLMSETALQKIERGRSYPVTDTEELMSETKFKTIQYNWRKAFSQAALDGGEKDEKNGKFLSFETVIPKADGQRG